MSNIVRIKDAKKKSKSHIGFLGLLLVVAIICFLLLSPIFSIKNVVVSGNQNISEKYIISASNILYGENILRLNKYDAINRIETIPAIKSCVIKRSWPSTIVITVTEKEAIAKAKFYGSNILIDENGNVIDVITDGSEINLPLLNDLTITDVVAGESVKCEEEEKLKNYLEVLKKLKENDMLDGVVKLNEKEGFLVSYKVGHIVFLGEIENLQRKMEWLKSIIEKEENPAYIDLHNLNKVVTKPVWGMDSNE